MPWSCLCWWSRLIQFLLWRSCDKNRGSLLSVMSVTPWVTGVHFDVKLAFTKAATVFGCFAFWVPSLWDLGSGFQRCWAVQVAMDARLPQKVSHAWQFKGLWFVGKFWKCWPEFRVLEDPLRWRETSTVSRKLDLVLQYSLLSEVRCIVFCCLHLWL